MLAKIQTSVISILIVLVAAILLADVSFKNFVQKELMTSIKNTDQKEEELISTEDIQNLPPPVQKYLRYAKVIGKEKIKYAWIKQEGTIRADAKYPWLKTEAEQVTVIDPMSRLWFAKTRLTPLFFIKTRDIFTNNGSEIQIKLYSLFKIAEIKGREMEQSGLVAFLNDMPLFPTAFLSKSITWVSWNSTSAKALITNNGIAVTGTFFFSENGEIVYFISSDKYRANGKKLEKTMWSVTYAKYKDINDLMIPTEYVATWNLDSGDLEYARFKLKEIELHTIVE